MSELIRLHLALFYRPTYAPMQLPSSVDWELRLYLPRRMTLDTARKYTLSAQLITETWGITAPAQWEVNRSGMCICISCGPNEREDILTAVNAERKEQKLKPIEL